MRRWLLTGCVLCLPIVAQADQGGVQVQHAWSRPAMAGRTGVVYLSITEHGQADRLTGVSSPVAAKAELHETIDDHGVMKMRTVASLPVRPGKPLTLKPNGYHIMLMGLKHPLKAGDSVPLTLTFAKAGQVNAVATVEKNGAEEMQHGATGGTMDKMKMP